MTAIPCAHLEKSVEDSCSGSWPCIFMSFGGVALEESEILYTLKICLTLAGSSRMTYPSFKSLGMSVKATSLVLNYCSWVRFYLLCKLFCIYLYAYIYFKPLER